MYRHFMPTLSKYLLNSFCFFLFLTFSFFLSFFLYVLFFVLLSSSPFPCSFFVFLFFCQNFLTARENIREFSRETKSKCIGCQCTHATHYLTYIYRYYTFIFNPSTQLTTKMMATVSIRLQFYKSTKPHQTHCTNSTH